MKLLILIVFLAIIAANSVSKETQKGQGIVASEQLTEKNGAPVVLLIAATEDEESNDEWETICSIPTAQLKVVQSRNQSIHTIQGISVHIPSQILLTSIDLPPPVC